jgi:cytochrome c oxidase assembly protein subunit 11
MSGKTRTVALAVAALAVMVGLVAASVPLYSLFCRVSGFGGTPRIASGTTGVPVGAGTVVVRFDGTVMKGLPWRFAPVRTSMRVRLGEPNIAYFSAENTSNEAITGTASFNVTPAKAGPYVDKIQCFCFSEQRLGPGQRVEMPVSFYIDPAIASDPNTSDVTTITLSYAFFRTPQHNEGAS